MTACPVSLWDIDDNFKGDSEIERRRNDQNRLAEWKQSGYIVRCGCQAERTGPPFEFRSSSYGQLFLRAHALRDHDPRCPWLQDAVRHSLRDALASDGTYMVRNVFPLESSSLPEGGADSKSNSHSVTFERFLRSLCSLVSSNSEVDASTIVALSNLVNKGGFSWNFPIPIHELLRFNWKNSTQQHSKAVFIGKLVCPKSKNMLAIESCMDEKCITMKCMCPEEQIRWGSISAVRALYNGRCWGMIGDPIILG